MCLKHVGRDTVTNHTLDWFAKDLVCGGEGGSKEEHGERKLVVEPVDIEKNIFYCGEWDKIMCALCVAKYISRITECFVTVLTYIFLDLVMNCLYV